jgi:hypothetical protein
MLKIHHQGRLGNILLINAGASIISKKYNLKVQNYNFSDKSINFYDGDRENENFITLNDSNVFKFLQENEDIHHGIIVDCYFQTSEFILKYFKQIKEMFSYCKIKEMQDNLFIHVRLGDVIHLNPGLEYYSYCIENSNFKDGYISSDSPEHPIVLNLIKKYNLKLYNNNNILDTIFFASSFDNLILSNGTFSWWIGFLSNQKNIFYPIPKIKWHGDIYIFENWSGICL